MKSSACGEPVLPRVPVATACIQTHSSRLPKSLCARAFWEFGQRHDVICSSPQCTQPAWLSQTFFVLHTLIPNLSNTPSRMSLTVWNHWVPSTFRLDPFPKHHEFKFPFPPWQVLISHHCTRSRWSIHPLKDIFFFILERGSHCIVEATFKVPRYSRLPSMFLDFSPVPLDLTVKDRHLGCF